MYQMETIVGDPPQMKIQLPWFPFDTYSGVVKLALHSVPLVMPQCTVHHRTQAEGIQVHFKWAYFSDQ